MTAYLYNPLWKSLRDSVVNCINIAGGNVSQGSYTANASGVIAALQQLITQIQSLNTASTNAQTTATAAQTTANSAQTTATAAQNTANSAQSTASTAQSLANAAQTAANTAQTTANTAQTTATAAQTAANTAQTAATAAQNTANSAQTNLNSHISALGGVHGLSITFSPLGVAGAGRVVQYGSASPNGALGGPYTIAYFREMTITFPTAYTVTPRVAVSSAIPASAWQVTTTGFTLRMWGDSSLAAAAFPVDWIAVGAT